MLRAILFDFDGVLADTEPIHLEGFRQVLQGEGIELSREDYFASYLGLDDRACFRQIFSDHGKELLADQEERLLAKKSQWVLGTLKQRHLLLPGVKPLLKVLQNDYYFAIVSGALKSEVSEVLVQGGVAPFFRVVIGADDVANGKPDPEGYLTALKELNRNHIPTSEILLPEECVVVEDSPWGIRAGKAAGMKCIGITHSYGRDSLQEADWIITELSEITALLKSFEAH